jgi:hypothetical protein
MVRVWILVPNARIATRTLALVSLVELAKSARMAPASITVGNAPIVSLKVVSQTVPPGIIAAAVNVST